MDTLHVEIFKRHIIVYKDDGPFCSRTLNESEYSYTIDDLNCIAVLFALENFKTPYIIVQSFFDPIAYLRSLENASPRQQYWLSSLYTYSFSWEPTFILDADILKIDSTIPDVSRINSKCDIEKREIISQFLRAYRRTFYPAILSSQNSA